jgi:hypothetical protein
MSDQFPRRHLPADIQCRQCLDMWDSRLYWYMDNLDYFHKLAAAADWPYMAAFGHNLDCK